jgi:hypothetical protein
VVNEPWQRVDILLHLHFFSVAQFLMRVDLLLQHPQVVAHHDDFVEENLKRNLLDAPKLA